MVYYQIQIFIAYFLIIDIKPIGSWPVRTGFTVKYNVKHVARSRSMDTESLFARIPHTEFNKEVMQEVVDVPIDSSIRAGRTNRIAKISMPTNNNYYVSDDENNKNFEESYINLPMMKQQHGDYKILVAEAPPNIRLGRDKDDQPLLVYIVFEDKEEDQDDSNSSINIPSVYFVHKMNKGGDETKELEPILVVDHNRTVTGFRSKGITKFVSFKNKE